MEGVGILRFSLTDQRVVYCLKDLCQLLGIKYSNRLRGELNNKFVYSLTVKDEGKPVKMLFIDIGNLNTVVQIAGTTSKSELFSKWFAEEIFPISIKDDVYSRHKCRYGTFIPI